MNCLVFSEDQLIDTELGEWKYKPKPKEIQKEFQQNFFKKYEVLFVFLLMFVIVVAGVYAWQNGLITDFLELFENV